jgi:sialic acid synthase SpsE
LNPAEFAELVRKLRLLKRSLDHGIDGHLSWVWLDTGGVEANKGLVAARDLPAGKTLREEDLAVKPPFRGLTPRQVSFIVGKQLLYDLKEDDPITFAVLNL